MEFKPLISIIVPCFNSEKFLTDTLTSIDNQSYKNWECIIIDDGSTDSTQIIANNFIKSKPRFKFFKKNNGGSASARNDGLIKSNGDYIIFLDSDDLISEDKLLSNVNTFKDHPDVDIVVNDYKILDDRTNRLIVHKKMLNQSVLNYEDILLNWDVTFNFPTHCCLYNKNLFKYYTFDTSIKAKEDWVMALYLFKAAKRIIFLDIHLSIYRFHGKSKMRSARYFTDVNYTFQYVYENLTSSELKAAFFKKTNNYWLRAIDEKSSFINTLIKSKKFLIGELITTPIYFIINKINLKR